MPLSPLIPSSSRYYLRRPDGLVSGPFEVTALAGLFAEGKLQGSEEISTDQRLWRPLGTVLPAAAAARLKEGARTAPLDLGNDDILLAPLELGLGNEPVQTGAPSSLAGSSGDVEPSGRAVGHPLPADDLEGMPSLELELEERKPAGGRPSPAGQQGPAALPATPVARTIESSAPEPVVRIPASPRDQAMATLLQDAAVAGPADATQPIRLESPQRGPHEERLRKRTLTAARPASPAAAASSRGWRPSKRVIIAALGIISLGGAAIATFALDLPDRLRGEPDRGHVLGETAEGLAQDRFPAFATGARLLEEAAGARRNVAATRAAAAELLASSVVLHGAERGRLAQAEALLAGSVARDRAAAGAQARAQAWVALGKGRWKEAERLVDTGVPGLSEADRAMVRGWAALGREEPTQAAISFQSAVQTEPPPMPSRVAARFSLARAKEAEMSAAAEEAFRAVLSDAPAHVGAALGLARVANLTPMARLKLVEAIVAKQAQDASRAELGEAQVLVARIAFDIGQAEKAEAALKRATAAEPTSVALAVLVGDCLLGEGRLDDAVARYRAALTAPVSAPRTTWLRVARLAALVESEKVVEATTALTALDQRLPADARLAFWRGRLAERAHPSNLPGAEQAYREALKRDPRFVPASLQLARLLIEQRRGADALVVLRRAERDGTPATPLRMALGQALLVAGNVTEAVRTFKQVVEADPGNPAAHLALASALEASGALESARAQLAPLMARGGVPQLGGRMAALLVRLGRKTDALATYRQEIASGGGTAASRVAAARLALELGQNDVARALAQQAVDEDARAPGALLVLAEVRRADGDLSRALAELRRALALDGSQEVQLEYGRALAALGRDEDALSALTQAGTLPEADLERGRILLHRGDVEGATKALMTATAGLPRNGEAFLLLGNAEDRLGHGVRAEAAWKTAVRLSPRLPEARYRLGRLQMDQGRPGAALIHLRTAAEQLAANAESPPPGANRLAPKHTSEIAAWRSDLYFQLAFAELRQGSRDRARAAFNRYLETAPSDAPARVEVSRQLELLTPAVRP